MKHLKTFENNDERSEMIDQLCEMGYERSQCDAMSYEELCDCMEKELSKEDSWNEEEEITEENIFKNVGKFLGIKPMSDRVDAILGFDGEDFTPSQKLKVYVSQAEERNWLPTTDMNVIEEALRKAREVGYGLDWAGEVTKLEKEMQGSEEEKKIAKHLISRALGSIHSTAGGGHEFGHRPNISGLKDNVSHSKLRHLKSFESFSSVNEEEGKFREFFTGHASKEDKEAAKQKFMKAIEDAEKELMKNPEDYAQSENWETVKSKLMKQAQSDNYKGGLRVQRGGRDPRVYIVYDEGVTGFQKLAGAAAGEVHVRK